MRHARGYGFLTALLLAACATPEAPPPQVVEPLPAVVAPAIIAAAPPPKAPAARPKKPGPLPVKPLNVYTECRFRNETGYNGELRLAVDNARVGLFEARVNIPRHGSCRFDLKHFKQTRELPGIELAHRSSKCTVHLWEQEERVSVAFQNCQKMCSGKAFDYLWPILNDRRDGSCA